MIATGIVALFAIGLASWLALILGFALLWWGVQNL